MSAQLIVAGFHRSGTSLTAQLLHRSGVFLGDQMLPRHRSNPHGHFEDREIVKLHEAILADNELTWQVDGPPFPKAGDSHRQRMREIIEKREAEHEVWGFKDPRVCLFMDIWKALLPDARVLLVYRSFAESTYSLHQRHANSMLLGTGRREFHRGFWEVPDLALKMWLVHNRALLDFAHSHPEDVLAVSFEMLRKGFPVVGAINQLWGLDLKKTATREVFDQEVTTEKNRRCSVSDESLIGAVLDTWEALEELSKSTEALAGTAVERDRRLTKEDFYVPTEAYALLMERELRDFEVRLLEGRLEEAERSRSLLQKQLESVESSRDSLRDRLAGEESRKKLRTQLEETRKHSISPQRKRALEQAEKDLRLVIKRMSESRLAPIFRLKKGFRELEKRYFR